MNVFGKIHKHKLGIANFTLVITSVGITLVMTAQSFAATLVFSPQNWDTSLDNVIHSDDSQSTMLPNGKILWTFGDTIQVNGTSTVSAYGYPHDVFVLQTPNTMTFQPVTGSYGYGWQQVPNWSDGSYFWMETPVVDGDTLYVIGQRIQGVSPFTVDGSYVAEFNATTLTFERTVPIPGGASGQTTWGAIAKVSTGWWITGSHAVSCSYATDCKVGDIAFVPFGGLATSSQWQVYNNVIPASDNIGTTLGMVKTTAGWDIFTKTGDAYGGSTIERLSALTPIGAWAINGSWSVSAPSGAVSYGVAVHPEQGAPSGQVLVSYNVNDFGSTCWPQFLYLPK